MSQVILDEQRVQIVAAADKGNMHGVTKKNSGRDLPPGISTLTM